jgi:prephenate dehydrogenase
MVLAHVPAGKYVARVAQRTALVGFGRFGRALGGLLAEAGRPFRAFDPRGDVPDAVRAGSLAEVVRGASVVVVAVPVAEVRAALVALRPLVGPRQLVIDVASVKVGPAAALAEVLGADVPWAATHPLFGPTSLALGERPLRVVVCPSALHPRAARRARAFYEALGCEVVEQSAEDHDRAMADTHALTFFVAKGLLDVGAGEGAKATPPSFQAIARTIDVVRSDAGHLFAALHRANPFAAAARARLLEALGGLDRALREGVADHEEPRVEARVDIPGLGERAPDLREVRDLIDEVDAEILGLLARRAHLAKRAARAKATLGRGIVDRRREGEVLAARRAKAEALALDPEDVEGIFRAVLRFSRRAQAPASAPAAPPRRARRR